MKMYQCVFKIFKVHETPRTEEQERNHLSNGDFHKQFRTGNHGLSCTKRIRGFTERNIPREHKKMLPGCIMS